MAFIFHWVDIGTTEAEWITASTWNPAYAIRDEEVLFAKVDHREGQVPSLTVQVKNPKVGLLSAGRKRWAWFGWNGAPLFFGRLVGIPTDLLGEAVTLQFTARSKNYITEKQIAAESLKVRPYYDPVFIAQDKRDDPDAILEGYSALWHVDRVTLKTTPSDILVGEDGLMTFLPSEVPYDSVQLSLNESPLIAVAVNADVSWSQEFTGYIDTGDGSIKTYSGDGILSDWPAPASDLGGGWTVLSSFAKDVYRIETTQNISYTVNFQNNEKNHNDGDTLTYNVSRDYPNFGVNVPVVWREISRQETIGVMDLHTVDIYGNPSPTNIPASVSWNASYVPMWKIKYRLGLRYDANRQRTERIEFILQADTQPILADARISEESDNIQITGADVGKPIINFRNWTSVAGRYVGLGEFVFPDDPLVAGQKSIQVSIQAGVAGTVIPTFSNVAGETTVDGTVVWSSLGYASGLYDITTDWQNYTLVPLGEIILPHIPFSIPYKDYVTPGRMQEPEVGTNVDLYFIVSVPNKGYYQCSLAGTTKTGGSPDWKTTIGSVTNDGTVKWTFIGPYLPSGVDYYICTHSGITGATLPPFGLGETLVNDGDVVWTKLAASEVPIGGAPGMIGRNDYFPTDRGNWSIEYLMCLARAKLRMRSRAVEISFDCRFEKAAQLSCRMNGRIYDPRLPGGVAVGKVIGYSLTADGDNKQLFGQVTLGCAVGQDGTLVIDEGEPDYIDDDYIDPDYYEYLGVIVNAGDDMGYTPPASNVIDKFVFPLTTDQAFRNGGFVKHGSLSKQVQGIQSALQSAWIAANLTPNTIDSVNDSLLANQLANQAAENSVQANLAKNPMWLELQLNAVSGLAYDNFYGLETTPLLLPKMIDLEATTVATPPITSPTIHYAEAHLVGVGNGQVIGAVPLGHMGALIAGQGFMGVATIQWHTAVVPFSGSGTMAVKTVQGFQVGAAFAGAGSLRARAVGRRAARAGFSGAGTMVAVANIPGANARSALAGTGTMVARTIQRQVTTAALAGAGTMVAIAT